MAVQRQLVRGCLEAWLSCDGINVRCMDNSGADASYSFAGSNPSEYSIWEYTQMAQTPMSRLIGRQANYPLPRLVPSAIL